MKILDLSTIEKQTILFFFFRKRYFCLLICISENGVSHNNQFADPKKDILVQKFDKL